MNEIKVRTGYYAHAAKYQKNGYLTVSISLITPRWAVPYVEHRIAALAPSQSILDTLPDTDTYTKRYREEVLSRLDPKKIYEEEIAHFANLLGKKKVVLLCYESAEKFCHRHLVADWLNDAHPWGDAAERVDEIALSELAPTATA